MGGYNPQVPAFIPYLLTEINFPEFWTEHVHGPSAVSGLLQSWESHETERGESLVPLEVGSCQCKVTLRSC